MVSLQNTRTAPTIRIESCTLSLLPSLSQLIFGTLPLSLYVDRICSILYICVYLHMHLFLNEKLRFPDSILIAKALEVMFTA